MEPLPKHWYVGLLAEQSDTVCLGIYKVKMGQSWHLCTYTGPATSKLGKCT